MSFLGYFQNSGLLCRYVLYQKFSRYLSKKLNVPISPFQEKLNFSYVLKTPEDGAWGAVNEDGSWSGMVGSLMNKECDVGRCHTNLQRVL